jgi:tRNA pseudouridine32 synthase/23S rRNA pseudouridine746 synthase
MKNSCFIKFKNLKAQLLIPNKLNDPFNSSTPEICKIAAAELQEFILDNEQNWQYGFGLNSQNSKANKGKMFGVLVVKNSDKEIGYLGTFSGKLINETQPSIFVPPLFDISTTTSFLGRGMLELSEIGSEIKSLETEVNTYTSSKIKQLKNTRKEKSTQLQQKLFDQYQFLNKLGELKSLQSIFKENTNRNPPAGTGDCAAPKLLHYAYRHNMKPLAIAEFWWGKQTKSKDRKHGAFYPPCNHKCRPLLKFMM